MIKMEKSREIQLDKLTDLPNIGPVLAKNLEQIGVICPAQLREMGPQEAFLRIRALVDQGACLLQLEALAGAAEGIKKSLLSPERKAELKAWHRAL